MPLPVTIEALNHVTHTTTRPEESKQFYVNVLGFREISRPNFPFGGSWLYGYGIQIHLVENHEATKLPPGIPTRANHVAFSISDVDAMETVLKDNGIEYKRKLIADRNIHQLYIQDPDGHVIELGQYNQIDV